MRWCVSMHRQTLSQSCTYDIASCFGTLGSTVVALQAKTGDCIRVRCMCVATISTTHTGISGQTLFTETPQTTLPIQTSFSQSVPTTPQTWGLCAAPPNQDRCAAAQSLYTCNDEHTMMARSFAWIFSCVPHPASMQPATAISPSLTLPSLLWQQAMLK